VIKRYDVEHYKDAVANCNCESTVRVYAATYGEWVRYDDIKHLIPDNRVTEDELSKIMDQIWIHRDSTHNEKWLFIFEIAKEKGWIKPEGER
jgi:hypothetical protein